jgi:hypothetical protein
VSVFELASGDYLVISPAGVRTIVLRRPYPLAGGIGIVRSLRTSADAIEQAEVATSPLDRPGVCGRA